MRLGILYIVYRASLKTTRNALRPCCESGCHHLQILCLHCTYKHVFENGSHLGLKYFRILTGLICHYYNADLTLTTCVLLTNCKCHLLDRLQKYSLVLFGVILHAPRTLSSNGGSYKMRQDKTGNYSAFFKSHGIHLEVIVLEQDSS